MASQTTLYYAAGTCAQAVLIALYEADAQFTLKTLSFADNEQRSPEYLSINPKGRVPALATERGVLTETPALLLYVAQTHPQARLAPLHDPFALAQMQEFNAYLASTAHIAHAHRPRASRWADDEAAQAAMRAKVPQNMRECFAVIEQHYLGDKTWVMGEQFTVADGYLFTVTNWAKPMHIDLSGLKNLGAYNASTKTAAVLNGDSTLRSIQSQVRSALTSVPASLEGSSVRTLSDIGISFKTTDGKLTLDNDKFAAAIDKNPEAVANLAAAIGSAFDTGMDRITGTGGQIQASTEGLRLTVKSLESRQEALTMLKGIDGTIRARILH